MTTRKTAHTRAGGCVSSFRPIGCWPRAKTSPTSPGAECSGADLLPVAESVRRVESRRRQEIYHDARGEGWTVNDKKIQRLWRDEGLRVRNTAGGSGWAPRPRPTQRSRTRRTGVGGRFPVRVHDRRPAGQDGLHGGRAHPRMPRRTRRTLHHRRPAHRRARPARRPPATRPYCAATTDPNSPVPRWPSGPVNASGWRSSRPANPDGTAASNPSTASSATNASTSTCSGHSPTPGS